MATEYYSEDEDEWYVERARHVPGARYVTPAPQITIETTLRNIAESDQGRYWTAAEKSWVSSTEWTVARFVVVSGYLAADDLRAWVRAYGPTGGLAIATFGNKSVWKVQAKLLGDPEPPSALNFKKTVEDECSRIGLIGAMIAQAAFTALSLTSVAETHWTARASYMFSLISALLAVYYAGSQVWAMSRLSEPAEVKQWIRGGKGYYNLREITDLGGDKSAQLRLILEKVLPAPSSVLTVSAPRLLLSAALKSLLIGLGIYLGLLWQKNIQISDDVNDNRNVFIVYLVGLVLCYGVYSLSGINQTKNTCPTVRSTIGTLLLKASQRRGKARLDLKQQQERPSEDLNQRGRRRQETQDQQKRSNDRRSLSARIRNLERDMEESRQVQELLFEKARAEDTNVEKDRREERWVDRVGEQLRVLEKEVSELRAALLPQEHKEPSKQQSEVAGYGDLPHEEGRSPPSPPPPPTQW